MTTMSACASWLRVDFHACWLQDLADVLEKEVLNIIISMVYMVRGLADASMRCSPPADH